MLQTLKLLLPALIPSWRFFDTIAPSPRIEFALVKTPKDAPECWQELRPRPARVPVGDMLKRLFWNPYWNESLFLVACAERLMQTPTEHSAREIVKRIVKEVDATPNAKRTPYLQFRLVFLHRHGEDIQKHITFTSPLYRHEEGRAYEL